MADSMNGIPGANTGGTNVAVPSSSSQTSNGSLGNGNSPFTQATPTGTQMPAMTSSVNGAPPMSQMDPFQLMGGSSSWVKQNDFIKAMRKSGFSAGDAGLLYSFLQSGAGYNPQVAQALIAQMQPGIQRGQADIMEQFSGMGLRGGSPAAIGMGDFMSQVQLNEGQIFAQLYEQSVQNYLSVLMGGKGNPPASGMQNILMGTEAVKNLATAAASAASIGNGGGGSKTDG